MLGQEMVMERVITWEGMRRVITISAMGENKGGQ